MKTLNMNELQSTNGGCRRYPAKTTSSTVTNVDNYISNHVHSSDDTTIEININVGC